MTETELYKAIKEAIYSVSKSCDIRKDLIDIVRIESPMTIGIPDMNICINGKEFWIEAKVHPNQLSSFQRGWKAKREMAGGLVFVITYVNQDHYQLFGQGWVELFNTLELCILYIFTLLQMEVKE